MQSQQPSFEPFAAVLKDMQAMTRIDSSCNSPILTILAIQPIVFLNKTVASQYSDYNIWGDCNIFCNLISRLSAGDSHWLPSDYITFIKMAPYRMVIMNKDIGKFV